MLKVDYLKNRKSFSSEIKSIFPCFTSPLFRHTKQTSKNVADTTFKPIHTKWVTQYYNHICTDKDVMKNGWHRSGITKAIKENISKEDPFEN